MVLRSTTPARHRQFVHKRWVLNHKFAGEVPAPSLKVAGLLPGFTTAPAGTSFDFMLKSFGLAPAPSVDLALPLALTVKGVGFLVVSNTLTVPLSLDLIVNGAPSGLPVVVIPPFFTGYVPMAVPPTGIPMLTGTLLRFNATSGPGAGAADVAATIGIEVFDMLVGYNLAIPGAIDYFTWCTKSAVPGNAEVPAPNTLTVSGARIHVPVNTLNGVTPIKLYRNGIQVGPTYNLPATTTGTFAWAIPVGLVFNPGDTIVFESDTTASGAGTGQINVSLGF